MNDKRITTIKTHATTSQGESSNQDHKRNPTNGTKLEYDWKNAGRSALFTCHRSGVDPRKMPVDPACGFPQTGGYELTSWSPLLQKNQRATRRTHEPQCKNKRSKIGVATPGALSTRCACPPRGGCLPGRPSQGSPAQCSKWHHWHCPIHWKCWTSGDALGWDQPSEAHRGEGLWAPTSCKNSMRSFTHLLYRRSGGSSRTIWRTTLPEVIWRKRELPIFPFQKLLHHLQQYPPRVTPFSFWTISQGLTLLKTKPHSMRPQKA